MKYISGLLFMFTLINVSICSTLREIDFIQSLYPNQGIPKSLFTAIVNRRISQLNSFHEHVNKTFVVSDAAEKYLSIAQNSLSLIVDFVGAENSSGSNRYSGIKNIIESYEQTVNTMSGFYSEFDIYGADFLIMNGLDRLDVRDIKQEKFKTLVDDYFGDVKLVRDYEESIGHYERVSMKILESLKLLSVELGNNLVQWEDRMDKNIGTKAMVECFTRLKLILQVFKQSFI